MYYQMYPSLYAAHNFIPSNEFQRELPYMKFNTLQDALEFAKATHVALREQNWYLYECGIFGKKRVALKTLFDMGIFSNKISSDDISIYYNWKT